jgi:REP element-mobilizing transposase RayT
MHSFNSCLIHCVWTTKRQENVLTLELQKRLWPYIGGIARENRMKALAIGGVANHVHSLVSLPSTLSVAKALQLLKGNSSNWLHQTFPDAGFAGWQKGYGAFSIGISGVQATTRYILTQEEHHRKRTFREELITILKKHGLPFDDRMLD